MSTEAAPASNASGAPRKLTFKEKFSYAIGQMPGTFYGSFTGQIQAFYYTWMGLGIKYIIIGQIIYGIWNLVNDPIFGVLQDHTRSKDGRYIPWIKIFSPLFTIAFIVLFFPPQLWRYGTGGEQYQIALATWYLLSQCLYDTGFTIVYLAHVALAPQMTMDEKERVEISIMSSITGLIGIAASAAFPLIYLTNPTPEKIASFQIVVIIIAIIGFLPWIFIVKYVKERQEFIPPKEVPFWESVKCVFKNPSGRIYMVYDGISVGLLNGIMTAITFLLAWVFGVNDYNPGWTIMNVIWFLVPVVLCFLLGIWIELKIPQKYDVKTALMFSMICEAIGFLIAYLGVITSTNLQAAVFVVPDRLWLVSLGMSIAMIGFPGDFIYHNPMRADTIDYDELLTGERRESVYAGVGCVLSKPMISVALASIPAIIAAYGLVPASPGDPVDKALVVKGGFDQAIIGVATAGFLFASILAFIGVFFWIFYPLNRKKLQEVRKQLEEIHAKKRSERLDANGMSKFSTNKTK